MAVGDSGSCVEQTEFWSLKGGWASKMWLMVRMGQQAQFYQTKIVAFLVFICSLMNSMGYGSDETHN